MEFDSRKKNRVSSLPFAFKHNQSWFQALFNLEISDGLLAVPAIRIKERWDRFSVQILLHWAHIKCECL